MTRYHQGQGSPTSRPQTHTSCQISDGIRLEIKCTINVMCLNHPQTISPPTVCRITVFPEISPCRQKRLQTAKGCWRMRNQVRYWGWRVSLTLKDVKLGFLWKLYFLKYTDRPRKIFRSLTKVWANKESLSASVSNIPWSRMQLQTSFL